VEKIGFDCLVDVRFEGEGGVKDYAKVACLIGGGNNGSINGECYVSDLVEGGFGAD